MIWSSILKSCLRSGLGAWLGFGPPAGVGLRDGRIGNNSRKEDWKWSPLGCTTAWKELGLALLCPV